MSGKAWIVGCLLVIAAALYSSRRSVLLIQLHRVLTGERGCAPLRDELGNVTLHYFASRGRAESIRLLLEETETRYVETGFTGETWPAAKDKGLKSGLYPFGLGMSRAYTYLIGSSRRPYHISAYSTVEKAFCI